MRRMFLPFIIIFALIQPMFSHGMPPGKANTAHIVGVAATNHSRAQQTAVAVADVVGYSQNGITVAGGNGYGRALNQFEFPVDVVVDAAGNLYVCDASVSRVLKFTPGATMGIVVAGDNGLGIGANQLNSPNGISVDKTGNIYIADLVNERIQKWAPGASSGTTVAGGNGTGSAPNQFYFPTSVFVDAMGNFYVSDVLNHRIQKFTAGSTTGVTVAGGNGVGTAANQLNSPGEVFVDANGDIYIADTENNRVQKWSAGASSGVTVAGGNGAGSAANQLSHPNNIFIDANHNIFVCDNGNHRIQKWAPGALSGITVAGGNGAGSAANQLDRPSSVYLDAAGNIYVGDGGNFRVQKFAVIANDAISCPSNLVIPAASCREMTTVKWTEPQDTFPSTLQAPANLDAGKGMFTYLGAFNGNGYYISANGYLWPDARRLARLLDGDGDNGHLLTLNNAAENNFIYSKIKGPGYAPWIGLFNTGTQGKFSWVQNESFNYSNWAPGEPNNAGGTPRYIMEPYVRMSGIDGRWNDQRDDHLQFIVEFEKPLIRYRQISGPKNGGKYKPGVYQVCYQRNNLATGKKDTCCFTVTVTCNATSADDATNGSLAASMSENDFKNGLQVMTAPNPSHSYFRLKITGTGSEQASLKISDMAGRILEVRSKIDPKQTVEIGKNLKPGIYFVQVVQGNRKAVVKIIRE